MTKSPPSPPSISSIPSDPYPQNIGIHYIDIYFPSLYVDQTELEQFNQVSSGKYTIGLGQTSLSFVHDREDIVSIALTALSNFMHKFNLNEHDIGRLEVGTETLIDHSKSLKSHLMRLFPTNKDLEGIDCLNACYGGTSALLNSINWIESSSYNNKLALVVAADIAEYASGPARPTGGVGAVVIALGPNAPLVFEKKTRTTYMDHVYDFWKPNLTSPYPVVDGKLSNTCYLRALDKCFNGYVEKYNKMMKEQQKQFNFEEIDYMVFHAPYNKLVQKSVARLLYNDFWMNKTDQKYSSLNEYRNLKPEDSYDNVPLEKACMALSKEFYHQKVSPSTTLPVKCGNMYTASLYAGLISLIDSKGAELVGKKLMCFSYGSGLTATLFAIRVEENSSEKLKELQSKLNINQRLAERIIVPCQQFVDCMEYRERLHSNDKGFKTKDSIDQLKPGTFYLTQKDDQGKRFYEQKSL